MTHVDFEFRDFLAQKILKFVPNLGFSAHLRDADPYANPITATFFFKHVWSKKYDRFKNNL